MPADLWVQEKVRTEAVLLEKVLGTENPADMFTNYLDRGALDKAIAKLNLEFRSGRAESAPETMGLQKPRSEPQSEPQEPSKQGLAARS